MLGELLEPFIRAPPGAVCQCLALIVEQAVCAPQRVCVGNVCVESGGVALRQAGSHCVCVCAVYKTSLPFLLSCELRVVLA